MNVTANQLDNLCIELKIEILHDDYAEALRKKLADARRKADFKGFRKGNVPMSLVQRVYGEQCLLDAVNAVISEQLEKYVSENNLHLLGEPLPSENQPENEWKDGSDFTFLFDLAKSPEISVDVAKEDTVEEYNITVSAKEKAEFVENLKKYYDAKKDDENAEKKTDEEIEKEAADRLKENYKSEASYRLDKDIRDYFVKKSGVQLPEDFLKRWLFSANDGKVSKEEIEKEFDGFAADFKWQLVRGFLMKKYDFKVEQNDLLEAAKAFVTYQYAMYGLSNVPEDILAEAANNMLHDQKQIENLAERVEDSKVIAKLKEEITIKPKKISSDKFKAL